MAVPRCRYARGGYKYSIIYYEHIVVTAVIAAAIQQQQYILVLVHKGVKLKLSFEKKSV